MLGACRAMLRLLGRCQVGGSLRRNWRGYSDERGRGRRPEAGHYRSPWDILKTEFNSVRNRKNLNADLPVPRETDALIIGGGAVGSSVAYWLKRDHPKGINVTIVERDLCYTRASTMLSVGGIRHQFSVPENVQLSMYTSQFLRNIKENLAVLDEETPNVHFEHQGYLFLADPEQAQKLSQAVEMQRGLGAKTELMSCSMLAKRFPWLNLEGVEVGSYGLADEGWFDPYSLVHYLRKKNCSMDVNYVHGEVTSFNFDENEVITGSSVETMKRLRSANVTAVDGEEYSIRCAFVVNCAGPWAGEVAKMAHIGQGPGDLSVPLPVEPRKRYVYVVHCPDGPGLDCPLVVDITGTYFRRDGLGGHYLCGMSPSPNEEPPTTDLEVDYEFFHDRVWPNMAHRAPKLENLKLKSAWAGFYDYNYADENLIIGNHPYHRNFFFANGLSGHGIQHAPAVGRALKELIVDGAFTSIDLTRFSFDRFLTDDLIHESGIV